MIRVQTLILSDPEADFQPTEGAKEPDDHPHDASMEVDERESSESSDSEDSIQSDAGRGQVRGRGQSCGRGACDRAGQVSKHQKKTHKSDYQYTNCLKLILKFQKHLTSNLRDLLDHICHQILLICYLLIFSS